MSPLLFLAALIAPLLYAFSNHIDKILLSKYFKEGGVGTLMIFSSLLSILIVPVAFMFDPSVLETPLFEIGILAFVGLLNLVLLFAYLHALSEDDPTVVIIFFQLVPVLGLVLGYTILGETITFVQIIAMALIVLGATIMTIVTDEDGQIVFRLRTVGFMFVASLGWALESTLFKMVALEENVYRSLFWESLSMFLMGVLLFLVATKYRENFLAAIRANSKTLVGLNVLNESLYIAGNAAASFVVVLIPVALNLLMNSFQPIFVFIVGVLLLRFFPSLGNDSVHKHMPQKIIAIVLTGIGAFLLGSWSN